MWGKSVFRKMRGTRTRELSQDGGWYEGLRCNFCQTGSDWGPRDGNRDQYRHSDFTWFYVNTSCNWDDHGGVTCISRLHMKRSAAMMASYVKRLHLPADAKNTVFWYVITRPQTKLHQRRGEICWLHIQRSSTDGVVSSENLVNLS